MVQKITTDDRVSSTDRDCYNCAWGIMHGDDHLCLRHILMHERDFPNGCVCLEIDESGIHANGYFCWCNQWNHHSNPFKPIAIEKFNRSDYRKALLNKFHEETVGPIDTLHL